MSAPWLGKHGLHPMAALLPLGLLGEAFKHLSKVILRILYPAVSCDDLNFGVPLEPKLQRGQWLWGQASSCHSCLPIVTQEILHISGLQTRLKATLEISIMELNQPHESREVLLRALTTAHCLTYIPLTL